jgi:seryl-tRNA synthetase
MSATNKLVEDLKTHLTNLENSLGGKKAEISKAYKEAIAAADKVFKESKSLAEKSLKEAEAHFTSEKAEIAKLYSALKVLTGESVKSGKITSKGERLPFPIIMPKSFAEGKNWNEKLVFIISQIGEGTNDDIIAAIAKADKSFKAEASGKTINLTLSKLKGAGNIATNGKKGKKDIYTSAK